MIYLSEEDITTPRNPIELSQFITDFRGTDYRHRI